MKKFLLAFTLFFLTGCNIYIIEVNKTVCVHGESNSTSMAGSELKDISADPVTDVKPKTDVKAPFVP